MLEPVTFVPEDGSPAEIQDLWNSRLVDPSIRSLAQPEQLVDCAQCLAAKSQGRTGVVSVVLVGLQENEPNLKGLQPNQYVFLHRPWCLQEHLLSAGDSHHKDSLPRPFVDQACLDQE